MEDHHHDQQQSAESRVGSPAVDDGGGGTSAARWNPTREQIELLEGLYGKGVRTPSTEHIQRIADMLRAYGSIEGKNVFYWFQNHKARQRQRERQEAAGRHAHPVSQQPAPPPLPVVVAAAGDVLRSVSVDIRSCCPSATHFNIGSYHHSAAEQQRPTFYGSTPPLLHPPPPLQRGAFVVIDHGGSDEQRGGGRQTTLQLFPVHPTGVLDDRHSGGGGSCVTSSASMDSGSLEEAGLDVELGGAGVDVNPPFFDFLGTSPKSSSF